MHNDGKALSAANRDVKAVRIEKEFSPARRIVSARGGHGNDRNGRFLPLKFVDGADLDCSGQPLAQEIDLQVVGCNHKYVLKR